MENTAPHRRDHRRAEYGDERIPEIREMLERISPVNHADKIKKPMCISHGENDTRVPIAEALRMWNIRGVQSASTFPQLCLNFFLNFVELTKNLRQS